LNDYKKAYLALQNLSEIKQNKFKPFVGTVFATTVTMKILFPFLTLITSKMLNFI
jgi:hypothetical protein